MTRLSVNINKIALLRNARGGNLPDLRQTALDIEDFGGQGITVHPRPDERHIRYSDIPMLRQAIRTEFNVEGNPTETFLQLVEQHPPAQCTLVPDDPQALTSDHGWDTIRHEHFLRDTIARLQSSGIRVSIFLDPDERMVEGAKSVGADRVEFYTGPYAHQYPVDKYAAVRPHIQAAQLVNELGLGVNAGHDLNLDNLAFYKQEVPGLLEVSIGHALVCDALYFGLKNTIQLYLQRLA